MTNSRKSWAHISANVEDIEEVIPNRAGPDTAGRPGPVKEDRRRSPRSATSQHVSVAYGNATVIADLVELSQTGARLRIVDGSLPNVRTRVSITLFDGSRIGGIVSWLKASYIGIGFDEPVADIDDRLLFEDLGQAYYSRALSLQKGTQNQN